MWGIGVAARAALTAVTGYLGIVTIAAWCAPHPAPPPSPPSPRRYRVLIPAHDEERLIGDTVASLCRLDYPAERLAVHVVADNCTDATAAVASAAGAEVHRRVDPDRPGKGPALQWLMARLRDHGDLGDAVVFVDADTVVDPGFLRAVDRHLDRGASVVQGYYAVRDDATSPVVSFRAAAMAARTYLRPLGRVALGGSAGLHGNGMVFDAATMAERRWSDHLTEDVELHLDLLLDGVLVAFAPDAVVFAEMPTTTVAARSQHERWERGRIELARRYGPTLVRRAVTGGPAGRVAYLDAAMDLLVPPLSVVAAGGTVAAALGAARTALSRGRRGRGDLVLAGATMAVLGGHVLAALRLTHAPSSTYRALLRAPHMVVWKLGLWLRVLIDPRRVQWVRTERNR